MPQPRAGRVNQDTKYDRQHHWGPQIGFSNYQNG